MGKVASWTRNGRLCMRKEPGEVKSSCGIQSFGWTIRDRPRITRRNIFTLETKIAFDFSPERGEEEETRHFPRKSWYARRESDEKNNSPSLSRFLRLFGLNVKTQSFYHKDSDYWVCTVKTLNAFSCSRENF